DTEGRICAPNMGYLLRMEGRHTSGPWLWSRRPRSMDHCAASSLHRDGSRPHGRTTTEPRRDSWSRLGRLRILQRDAFGSNRPSKNSYPCGDFVFVDVGSLRSGYGISQSSSHPGMYGDAGRFLLPDELRGDRGRIRAEETRVQPGSAAVW